MNADDLLRRALKVLGKSQDDDVEDLYDEIFDYLDAPKDAYELDKVIQLTHRKTQGIINDHGYSVTGFVLTKEDGNKCIVDMSAVRWFEQKSFFEMMHPPIDAPKDEPVAWISTNNTSGNKWLEYHKVTSAHSPELYSHEPLYLHPPTKTAPKDEFLFPQEPLGKEFQKVLHENLWDLYERDAPKETDSTTKTAPINECQHRIADARNKHVQSGYVCIDCKALFSAADHGTTKTAPKKPMTEEEIFNAYEPDTTAMFRLFKEGVRFAEKFHGIGGGE